MIKFRLEINNMKTILCSAFPGTGKSFLFENSERKILDSDSSKFDKSNFPQNYIQHIKENIGKVEIIFVSSHKIVREALVREELDFYLVYPEKYLKNEYLERYKNRGDTQEFVQLISDNWDNWLFELRHQKGCIHSVLGTCEYINLKLL